MSQSSGTQRDLSAVSFVDKNTGIAVGDGGAIIATTDGGVTWTPQISGTTNPRDGVISVDVDNATAVGNRGTILRTTDGGATWSPQSSETSDDLWSVSFIVNEGDPEQRILKSRKHEGPLPRELSGNLSPLEEAAVGRALRRRTLVGELRHLPRDFRGELTLRIRLRIASSHCS